MTKPYCLEHIPHNLLAPSARDAFFKWLASLPLSPIERKGCLLTWAAEVDYKLTRPDILQALAAPETSASIKAELIDERERGDLSKEKAYSIYKATLRGRK